MDIKQFLTTSSIALGLAMGGAAHAATNAKPAQAGVAPASSATHMSKAEGAKKATHAKVTKKHQKEAKHTG